MKPDYSKIALTDYESKIAQGILNSRTGEFRASRPPLPTKLCIEAPYSFTGRDYVYSSAEDKLKGETAYVWRMLAFYLGTHPLMPVTGVFYLDGGEPETKRAREKELAALVDKLLECFDRKEWHGVHQWGRALGYNV